MNKQRISGIIPVILSLILTVNSGATTIDTLRSYYLELENESWLAVENHSSTVRPDAVKLFIYKTYSTLATETLSNEYSGSEFYYLNKINEWQQLEKEIISIDNLFDVFRKLLQQYPYNERSMIDFIETVLEDRDQSVNGTLNEMYNTLIIRNFYSRALQEHPTQFCATRQSSQQVLLQLYNAISIAEIKGYAMIQFSWIMLSILDRGNFSRESKSLQSRFNYRTNRTQLMLQDIMRIADRSVWRCDPVHHVRGETYEEVTRLLQGYIENEIDLNNDETCRENCASYEVTQNFGCYQDMYCAQQPKCNGKLLNCQFVESDMWVCPSKHRDIRRYDFIQYDSGRVLGKKGSCTRGTTKVDSWWRWLIWHCSYCLCICDEQGLKSDRYFNLRPYISNTQQNKVVTGLRFRKVNRIIHLQIQEGILLPRGNINVSSVQWKPINNYTLSDRYIRNEKDYFTLNWDKRSMDLDDLMAPVNHVVTGARFRFIGTHLNFEIRVTEADFETGKLIDADTTSIWKSNDQTENSLQNPRTKFDLIKPDISILTSQKSLPDSKDNQFIDFTHTDFDADVAQTTVPFMDAQDVISIPPVPLSGAGIYHKGLPYYGGFIAPKLFTYDFSPYIRKPD